MKILILNPPDQYKVIENPDEKNPDKKVIDADDYGAFPPLGALYVLTYLEKNTDGHDLFFKDCIGEKIGHEKLRKYIEEIQPEVVGITSFTISLMDIVLVARMIREIKPEVHLCLGGHHPIAFPLQAGKLKEFDSIVVGEGEIAFTELIKCLEEKKDFTHIQGVYNSDSIEKYINAPMKRDKRYLLKVTAPPAYIDDIDTLPTPNREYIKHINYHSIVGVTSKLATMISSRGCPYKCTFCDIPFKQHRKRTAEKVIDEVEECLAMGYEEIHFYDDLFNITPQRVIEICDEIDRRGLKFHWDFRGRVNTVNYESLKRLKNSGCRMISFGIETGTDNNLKILRVDS
jgi:anaerobic magnesium-protoporphyrin IX monomethyl ester cyclase